MGVVLTGVSHGVGAAQPVAISSWGAEFFRLVDPLGDRVLGAVNNPNLEELTDEQLRESLRRGLSKSEET